MDILFISAQYIYSEKEVEYKYEKLPIFKNMDFANELKSFSKKGNVIVFIDMWATFKKNNKELTKFFGREENRGEILFYNTGYAMKKLINNNFESLKHKEFLKDISLGTNEIDMHLLMERIIYFYHKQGKNINNIYIERGNFNEYCPLEKNIFDILSKNILDNQLKQYSICDYQTCERPPVKILFTDQDGTIFGENITKEQQMDNRLALQDFTNDGNIVVVITKGHGAQVFDRFGIGYTNPNLYGIVLSEVASVCINNTNGIIYKHNYPSLPIAVGYESDKKEVVKLFLEYFLELGYTFDGIYAIGDSENDFGMIEYVKEIGGISSLIGKDITTFADFIEKIKNDKSKLKLLLK